jgi:hypothetical protein
MASSSLSTKDCFESHFPESFFEDTVSSQSSQKIDCTCANSIFEVDVLAASNQEWQIARLSPPHDPCAVSKTKNKRSFDSGIPRWTKRAGTLLRSG